MEVEEENYGENTVDDTDTIEYTPDTDDASYEEWVEVVFHFPKNCGRLPFSKKMRLSPFF
jgi:hypothetical protein